MDRDSERKLLFDERVGKCTQHIQEALTFLRTEAETIASGAVSYQIEGDGIGITYKTGGQSFCRFDPKFLDGHEGIGAKMFPKADHVALKEAGLAFTRADKDGPWISIHRIQDAKKVVPFIRRAHEAATQH
jgi:hypothetical protein